MSIFRTLAAHGQSIWLDHIHRASLRSGELRRFVREGIRGVTSNPTIFEKAIAGGTVYDDDIAACAARGASVLETYEDIALRDIAEAAATLQPLYDAADGADGFVSFEVDPGLARDTVGTVSHARRLFARVGRTNLMIKVPGTAEGVPAIRRLIADGINVNVTLLFSVDRYRSVLEAYLSGLELRLGDGLPVDRIASVASFFVSRIDTAVDAALADSGPADLRGRIAIDNAKDAYRVYRDTMESPRWIALGARGARPQRLLWASTGTKNPAYSPTLYVDGLIGPDTVNTVPPATLEAMRSGMVVRKTLLEETDASQERLRRLRDAGIDLAAITARLQDDGVDAFARSYASVLESIAGKRDRAVAAASGMTFRLGRYEGSFRDTVRALRAENIPARIRARDHTVWRPDPTEIGNRLGWLDAPAIGWDALAEIRSFAAHARDEGYARAAVIGMGGSSLAPDVFAHAARDAAGADGMPVLVLDSTHPDAVRVWTDVCDPERTLFLVSTKSGGTVETLSLFRHFHARCVKALGPADAAQRFVAITDPGSPLERLARETGFRAIFLADPNVGGRYSALTVFGLVPAALAGLDRVRLLSRARACDVHALHRSDALDSGTLLGAAMGALSAAGVDKLTVVPSVGLAVFGPWIEQLVAESTGKDGTGILPVVERSLADANVYGADRLFVHLRREGEIGHRAAMDALERAGFPIVEIVLSDIYDIGREFLRWEFATAVAGHVLGVQPFDQPNVESAKTRARSIVDSYRTRGSLPALDVTRTSDGLDVAAWFPCESIEEFLGGILFEASRDTAPAPYIALQAYAPPGRVFEEPLGELALGLRDRTRRAATVGIGPRFLHSTGQLHKGDAGNGLFIQFLASPESDVPIPGDAGAPGPSMGFGTLIRAQALGDRAALLDAGRKVATIDLGPDGTDVLRRMRDVLRRLATAKVIASS